MTNYERIKNMSIDEMAELFDDNLSCSICSRRYVRAGCDDIEDCIPYIKEWLEADCNAKKDG